jgi:hypothetical protein
MERSATMPNPKSPPSLADAQRVQRLLDASYGAIGAIPVPETRLLDITELMPMERRAFFGRAWADTVPMALGAAR